MSSPYQGGTPGVPLPPGRKHTVAVLTVITVVLVVGIIAMLWFGVRPLLGGGAGAPGPSGSSEPATAGQSTTGGQPTAPASIGPMAWSAPVTVTDSHQFKAWPPVVMGSGVDGVALVGWMADSNWFYPVAVDTATLKVLWSSDTMYRVAAADPNGLVVVTDADRRAYVLNQRTGQTVGYAPSAEADFTTAVGGGYIVTQDNAGETTVCGSRVTQPGKCVWQTTGAGLRVGQVFGNTWVDLGTEVVDVTTGQVASFGRRAPGSNTPSVSFEGPAPDRVIRTTYGASGGFIYQVWDTRTDTGIGDPIQPGSYEPLIYDSELPVFLIAANGTLTAYSWQTGQQQWQARLGPGAALGQIYSHTVLVSGAGQSAAGLWAVDAATGQVTGHNPAPGYLGGVSAGVAYMLDGSTVSALDATSLDTLGSLAYPAPGSAVAVTGNQVAAFTPAGQFYRLQT